ncbi:MAG: radical SAM protein [candidate division WOR-3 bacterium]|nr:radical SAM protein [candidate division WOR-3 bacterium]
MNEAIYPSYYNIDLYALAEKLNKILESCTLCPHKCGINRFKSATGKCRTKLAPKISSFGPHYGEEKELVGKRGSGTIFFSYCNLQCLYCQNYEISQLGEGKEVTIEELAGIMLYLEEIGCHNINLVTPTHVIPQIISALAIAKDKGLKLPIVYNSGGYDDEQILKLLAGVIDIYMPDAKYGTNEAAQKYSGISNYWDVNQKALLEMHRQVGDLIVNKNGIARRGLIIRHLVLPNQIASSFRILDFIATKLSLNTYVNIMPQYRPCYKAYNYPELSRTITDKEFYEVIEYAQSLGLKRIRH